MHSETYLLETRKLFKSRFHLYNNTIYHFRKSRTSSLQHPTAVTSELYTCIYLINSKIEGKKKGKRPISRACPFWGARMGKHQLFNRRQKSDTFHYAVRHQSCWATKGNIHNRMFPFFVLQIAVINIGSIVKYL